MSYYRLYFRDYEGHFCGCRQFEAPDEAHAIVRADRMCCGLNRELWGERRLLRRWDDGDGDRPFERPPSDLGRVLRGDAGSSGSGD
jgi:hypothetical protein